VGRPREAVGCRTLICRKADSGQLNDLTLRTSGRALWIAGPAERSFGSPFKIQGKSQRVLEPPHYPAESLPILRSRRAVGRDPNP
jgi:hypothetical protein